MADASMRDELEEVDESEQLVLSDVLNHVFDKGVVITGSVTISIAGIDLVRLGLDLVISSVETQEQRAARPRHPNDLPLLPPSGGE